jgi:hypothetical protein
VNDTPKTTVASTDATDITKDIALFQARFEDGDLEQAGYDLERLHSAAVWLKDGFYMELHLPRTDENKQVYREDADNVEPPEDTTLNKDNIDVRAPIIEQFSKLIHICRMAGKEHISQMVDEMIEIASAGKSVSESDFGEAVKKTGRPMQDVSWSNVLDDERGFDQKVKDNMDSIVRSFKKEYGEDKRFSGLIAAAEAVLPHVQLRIMQRDGMTPN